MVHSKRKRASGARFASHRSRAMRYDGVTLTPGPRATGGLPSYAENDVPQPQLDLALGFTNVKPPVSPCVT